MQKTEQLKSEIIKKATTYPVMEIFQSIQGEGFHQGKDANLIRLAGCDVGCVWCDVKESWETSKHQITDIHGIIRQLNPETEMVIISGGEPLMYDLDELTKALKKEGFKTHLETSATYPLSGHWDWITVSPKKFKKPLPEIIAVADELKVIVFHRSDIGWGKKFIPLLKAECKLYYQPEWGREKPMLDLIKTALEEDNRWKLSTQLHKYLHMR
jgi:7-carboxy-7-deazaguanine synthase